MSITHELKIGGFPCNFIMKKKTMTDWFDRWIDERNNLPQKSIIVTNRFRFPGYAERTSNLDDICYISISASDECALEHFYDMEEASHYLPDDDNVLNLNFDDITEDFTFKNEFDEDITYHAISMKQAKQIIDFVDRNKDKHIIVHCRAGQSRSVAVARAIIDCYPDCYAENEFNLVHPLKTPNPDVLAKVKRAFYEKNGFFNEN